MPFRTVVVTTHSKLEYSLEYLVYKTIETTKRIFLDEIATIIVQSTQVSITTSLLAEIAKRKIKIIFCDEKNNPSSELVPYYNNNETSKRVLKQIERTQDIKDAVWNEIIKEKIKTQALNLNKYNLVDCCNQLLEYRNEVLNGDVTNREGFAAKVYFNYIFHEGFKRQDDNLINASLNYGYTILLSQFSRQIVADGYLTMLGIHHKGQFNQFNFSCDLMEPFRYIVDQFAINVHKQGLYFKDAMREILTIEMKIDGKKMSIVNCIGIYVNSVLEALNKNDVTLIKFPEYYDM